MKDDEKKVSRRDPLDPARADIARRIGVVRAHLDENRPLIQVATESGVSLRTARRWLARYRAAGPAGLARTPRSDAGARKVAGPLIHLVEGMALRKPPLSVATLHRRIGLIARQQGWRPISYSSVYAIVRRLNPALITLAHEGCAGFRDRFELVHRHRAERPNATWQADHTELDLLVLDANGRGARPWLTTVIDDYSRAVVGYTVFIGAPSALNTSLALRQAIWRKSDPAWPMCGIPDRLYVDHGTDFTSLHLDQAAADLRFQLIYSTVGRPQGRGKVERLFRTINTELLPELPGHLQAGKPISPPRLLLPELDAAIKAFVISTYHVRAHVETGATPIESWRGDGWLPRMPDSLEALDQLLVMVAKLRVVHRDGIRFEGLRFFDPTLAAYVGETVTVRYDPRDLGEIRVFHRNVFLCRAINLEHVGQSITLKDIQMARIAYRRRLQHEIREKTARVADYLPALLHTPSLPPPCKRKTERTVPVRRPQLKTYFEDD